MTETATLETALQATLERLVENRLASLRQELTAALQRELSGFAGGASTGTQSAAGSAELNAAVTKILLPTGQTEIMTACIQAAGTFSGRCALFVRRGEAFAFWRAERFRDDAITAIRSLTIEPAGVFKDILDNQRTAVASRASGVIPAALDRALGQSSDGTFCLSPVVVQGRVVAALYADTATNGAGFDAAAIEILTRVTGLSLETSSTRAAARPAQAASASTSKQTEITDAAVIQDPAAFAEQAAPAPPPGSFAASIPSTPETAPSVTPPPEPESLAEADRESHHKAHRFARVAVQDLLSYHKNKIEQGRRNKNLYAMLKDDIEKTRENYRSRFGSTAARSYDYLHYELVLKLAGNDPEALGSAYPGADVRE